MSANGRSDGSSSQGPATAARRPKWRLHPSTWVAAGIATLAVLLANVPGQVTFVSQLFVPGYEWMPYRFECVGSIRDSWVLEHGWPFTYLWRPLDSYSDFPLDAFPKERAFPEELAFWRLNEDVGRFSGVRLAGDVAVGAVLTAIAAALFEAWRRRRARLLQFHLSEWFVLTTLVAVVLGWLVSEQKRFQKESAAAETARDAASFTWRPGGPSWLRALAGPDRFRLFDQVVSISVRQSGDVEQVADGEAEERPPVVKSLAPFRGVADVSLSNVRDLSLLEGLPSLRTLSITGELDGSQLAHLERLPLVTLEIHADLSKVDLAPLRSLTRLRFLGLMNTGVDDDGLKNLSSLEQLETLFLASDRITDDGLRHVGSLRNLRDLTVSGKQITAKGLGHLEGLRRLEGLDLDWGQIGPEGLVHLRPLVNLQRLDLSYLVAEDDDLERLAGMSQLQSLSLAGSRITDAGLVHLEGLESLECLKLEGTSIEGPGLVHLRRMRKLRSLSLAGSPVDDRAVEHLESLTSLESLDLRLGMSEETKVSEAGRRRLYHALPKCEVEPVPAGLNRKRPGPVAVVG